MEERIAKFFTYLLHPLFVPFYILTILLNANSSFALTITFKAKLIISGLVILATILIPLLIIFLLFRLKLVKSFRMESREERIYPLLVISIFYYLTYYLLKSFTISFIFSYYMLGSTFLAICALIISFYRKISLHMIGAGGMLGLLLGLSLNLGFDLFWFVVTAILLCGFLGFARIKSNSHKPSDIYSGFLVGAVVMFLLFIFL